jgi:hypothetical protein
MELQLLQQIIQHVTKFIRKKLNVEKIYMHLRKFLKDKGNILNHKFK